MKKKKKEVGAIVSFWDTPGIENWSEQNVKEYVLELLDVTNPICMIYCASPGTVANTKVIKWLAEACYGSKIFFALVCTNKYAGTKNQRETVINEFKEILIQISGHQPETQEGIFLCHKVGLVTAVNSTEFDNGEWKKDPEGVNELCFTIMKELDKDKLKGWCITLLNNRDFWTKMSHSIKGFFKDTLPKFFKFFLKSF